MITFRVFGLIPLLQTAAMGKRCSYIDTVSIALIRNAFTLIPYQRGIQL